MVILSITSKAGVKGFIVLSAVQVVFELPDGGCRVLFTDSTDMSVKESLNQILAQIPASPV